MKAVMPGPSDLFRSRVKIKNETGKRGKGKAGQGGPGGNQKRRKGRRSARQSLVSSPGPVPPGGLLPQSLTPLWPMGGGTHGPEGQPKQRISGESCHGSSVRCLVLWDSEIFISMVSFGFKAGVFGLTSGGRASQVLLCAAWSASNRSPYFLSSSLACCYLSSQGTPVFAYSFKGSETIASRFLISCLTSGQIREVITH